MSCPASFEELSAFADGELDAARDWMLLLGRKTAEEKVASFLYMLARRSMLTGCVHKNTPGMSGFELPLTRADIADYLGLTIETVSRAFSKLKREGIINIHSAHTVEILRPDDVREMALSD